MTWIIPNFKNCKFWLQFLKAQITFYNKFQSTKRQKVELLTECPLKKINIDLTFAEYINYFLKSSLKLLHIAHILLPHIYYSKNY